ncbi:MAG: hypothetical protein MUP15_06350 [Dehalococcoidia bacterium]|nr:hypothetical protein [Dehalococcoidia bacterium]
MRFIAAGIAIADCLGGAFAARGQPVGAEPPAATPTAMPVTSTSLTYEETCNPTTFRPDEWVVVDCVQHLTNHGESTIPGVYTSVSRYDGAVPAYYVVWGTHDGQYGFVNPEDTSYAPDDIGPGQTVEIVAQVLFKMSEGTFQYEMGAFSDGELLAPLVPVRLVATYGSAEPWGDLLAESHPLTEQAAEGMSSALYETMITNRGSRTISDLDVTLRFGNATLVDSAPPPESRNEAVKLARWDLASFGKESLAPGESLVIHTTYGSPEPQTCVDVDNAVIVQAAVAGERRLYGTRADLRRLVGGCPPVLGGEPMEVPSPTVGGGGETALLPPATGNATAVIALPHTGDGTTGRYGQVPSREATEIVGIALLLFGTAIAHRRTRLPRS